MVKLEVGFEEYPTGNICKDIFEGDTSLEAIKNMCDNMRLYIDSDEIEEENMSFEDVIDAICDCNGDGCDYIFSLKDLSSGEIYLDY